MSCRRKTGYRGNVTGEYKFLSIRSVKDKDKLMFRMFPCYYVERLQGKPPYAIDLIRQ